MMQSAPEFDRTFFSRSHYWQALAWKWERKKIRRPKLSLRYLTGLAGVRSAASLSRLFRGELHVTEEVVGNLCAALGLSELEKDFVFALFTAEKSHDTNLRARAAARADEIRRYVEWRAQGKIPLPESKPWMNHLGFALRELVELEDFRPDPAWMKARLRLRAGEAEIASTWETLLAQGAVVREGERYRTQASLETSGAASLAVNTECFRHFASVLVSLPAADQAVNAALDTSEDARNREALFARSICCSIHHDRIPELRARLEKFYEELFFWISTTPVPVTDVVEVYLGLANLTAPVSTPPLDEEESGSPRKSPSP